MKSVPPPHRMSDTYNHLKRQAAASPISPLLHHDRLFGQWLAERAPYAGPDIFDVAPPGVHALLAYRNVHCFTGVLDGTPLAVQE